MIGLARIAIFGFTILPDLLTVENERDLLQTLLERVGHRSHTEREIELQYASDVAREQEHYHQAFQLLPMWQTPRPLSESMLESR